MKRFGRIDILVNNVGGSVPGNAGDDERGGLGHARSTTTSRLRSLACKYVLPVMEKQGKGAIVNLASVAGLRMTPDRVHIAYSTTKLGILAFSKSTAIAYAKKGIRCNTVIPGLMHTALVEHRLAKTIAANDLQGLIDKRNAQCPPARWETRGTSRTRSCSSLPTRPATSRRPRSWLTAASPRRPVWDRADATQRRDTANVACSNSENEEARTTGGASAICA